MAGKRQMDRKDFLALTVTSVGAGAWLLACGGSDEDDGGTGGVGGTGPTAGKGGSGGTGPTGGGGTGPTGSGGTGPRGGTGPTGGGGTGPTGMGGTGAGGRGGTGAGGAGAGGTGAGAGGAGAGGTGAAGGGAGGTTSASCVTLSFMQVAGMGMASSPHDHVPTDAGARDEFLADLLAHINGPNATEPFDTPMEGPSPHSHTITFTAQEIATLKGGGMVTKVKRHPNESPDPEQPDDDDLPDKHTWEISCG